jgi:hypothetical protein
LGKIMGKLMAAMPRDTLAIFALAMLQYMQKN